MQKCNNSNKSSLTPFMFMLSLLIALSFAQSITPSAADTVTYTARDYAFDGPETIAAGWKIVALLNEGKDLHQIQFLKLPEGKTAADFRDEITANPARTASSPAGRRWPSSIWTPASTWSSAGSPTARASPTCCTAC